MDISESVIFLKSSPMFQMSLGSRELFHSNFLKWLFETYPTSIGILDLSEVKNFEVLAEHKNTDLIIRSKSEPKIIFAVLENKFKDIPNKEQLKKYKEDKKLNAQKYILLSLVPASYPQDGWIHISYSELGTRLEKWANDFKGIKSTRDKEFINEYIMMVHYIVCIVAKHTDNEKDEEHYWFNTQGLQELDEIRFSDTIKKFLGQKLAVKIESELRIKHPEISVNPASKPTDHELCVWVSSSLSRKKPSVTVNIERLETPKVKLFIQIEGHTYRHMVVWDGFKIKGIEDDLLSEYLFNSIRNTDNGVWLFSKIEDQNTIPPKVHKFNSAKYKSSARKNYNKYSPDNIYQYIKIQDSEKSDGQLSYDNIVETIVKDAGQAMTLLQNRAYFGKFTEK